MPELLQSLHPASAVVAAVATFILLTVIFALVGGWTWDQRRPDPEAWYAEGLDPPFPDDPPEEFDGHLYDKRRN